MIGQDLNTDSNKIKMATRASLKTTEELKIESITFPAFGTGVGGFPIEKCAKIMMQETINYINDKNFIKLFNFVLFDQSTFTTFVRELRKLLNSEEQY